MQILVKNKMSQRMRGEERRAGGGEEKESKGTRRIEYDRERERVGHDVLWVHFPTVVLLCYAKLVKIGEISVF